MGSPSLCSKAARMADRLASSLRGGVADEAIQFSALAHRWIASPPVRNDGARDRAHAAGSGGGPGARHHGAAGDLPAAVDLVLQTEHRGPVGPVGADDED